MPSYVLENDALLVNAENVTVKRKFLLSRRFSLFVSSAKGRRMQEGLFKIANVGQGVVCALFRAGIHSFGLRKFRHDWPGVSAARGRFGNRARRKLPRSARGRQVHFPFETGVSARWPPRHEKRIFDVFYDVILFLATTGSRRVNVLRLRKFRQR